MIMHLLSHTDFIMNMNGFLILINAAVTIDTLKRNIHLFWLRNFGVDLLSVLAKGVGLTPVLNLPNVLIYLTD